MNDSGIARVPYAWPKKGIDWVRFLAGFLIVFALFQALALALKSFRGEWGAPIAAAILLAIWLYVAYGLGEGAKKAAQSLGLAAPKWRGVGVSLVISAAVLAAVPLSLGSDWSSIPNSTLLALGIFFQAGIAEETLFRAYLFGRLRPGRPFWGAAWIYMLPFVAAHLFLLFTMDPVIASASILLSVVYAFPLARLYELGGNTIWVPAILHFAIQAGPKLVVPNDPKSMFPLVRIAACAMIPFGVFFARKNQVGAG